MHDFERRLSFIGISQLILFAVQFLALSQFFT